MKIFEKLFKAKIDKDKLIDEILSDETGHKLVLVNNYCIAKELDVTDILVQVYCFVNDLVAAPKTFEKYVKIAEILSDKEKMADAEIISEIKGPFSSELEKAKAYANAVDEKDPIIKRLPQIKDIKNDLVFFEKCIKYWQIREKKFNNDYSMINELLQEKEKSRVLWKRTNEILNIMTTPLKMKVAGILLKLNNEASTDPVLLAYTYRDAEKNNKTQLQEAYRILHILSDKELFKKATKFARDNKILLIGENKVFQLAKNYSDHLVKEKRGTRKNSK